MTQNELDQIAVFERLTTRKISQQTAAQALGLSMRQTRRKLSAYRTDGARSLIHGARGKRSNRQLTVGLWKPRAQKQGSTHLWRERRACLGELVQLDGSSHDWFEGKTAPCCLLAFIDDATSSVLWAEFCESESTESLLRATSSYLECCGRPLSLYTDRGGVYKVNIHNAEGDRETQFGRALTELDISLIHARSPQAKGRIERLFGTAQDRLVKDLRLAGISTREAGNRSL